MAKKAVGPEGDAGTPAPDEVEQITLADAIEQATLGRAQMEDVAQRVRSLQEQIGKSRGKFRAELVLEFDAAKRSQSTLAEQFEAMADFIIGMRIVVNGDGMTGEDALRRIVVLKKQGDTLRSMAGGINLHSFGRPRLEHARTWLKDALQAASSAWADELSALVMILEGIEIPADARLLFNSVWTSRNKPLDLKLVWNAKEQAWDVPDGVVPREDLQQYIDKVSVASRGRVTNGQTAHVHASPNEKTTTYYVDIDSTTGATTGTQPQEPDEYTPYDHDAGDDGS